MIPRHVIIVVVALFTMQCSNKQSNITNDPYAHLQSDQIKDILKKAIDKAGGIESWNSIDQLTYVKHGILYYEDSTEETNTIQTHQYSFKPTFSATITWETDSISHRIEYSDQYVRQYQNDQLIDKDPSQTVMSSLYVLGMPFKLLDKGAYLSYEGTTTIEGKAADVIKATYNPSEHENRSTQDVWWYYFDQQDGTYLGALVHHPPTYAFIHNMEFDKSTGLSLHKHRQSFRTDSARNIEYLRAEFWYSDYALSVVVD